MNAANANHTGPDQESWDEIKQRLQKRWGQIDDGDLKTPMSMAELSDLVQKKTGEAQEAVEGFLSEVQDALWQKAENLKAAVGPRLTALQGQASAQLGGASDAVRDGYQSVESQVRRKPGQAMTVAFGVGILAGLLLGGGRRS